MQVVFDSLTKEQLQTYLSEGLTALHQLQTGAKVVRVRFADRWTEYQETDSAQLEAYLNQLHQAILAKDHPSGHGGRRMPIYIRL